MHNSIIMKKLIVLFGLVALIMSGISAPTTDPQDEKNMVQLLVSPELSELVNKWITEYSAGNPDVSIQQLDIYDESSGYDLNKEGVLGIVTEEYLHSIGRESLWSMVVARDVIVPVISSQNPFSESINTNGLSPGQFAGVYTEPGKLTWGKILNIDDNTTVNSYCIGDESLTCCLAEFLQADNLKGNVTKVSDNTELIKNIGNDKYSIGFCRLSGLIDYENHSIKEGLLIVPVDINGNGTLEHNENIYRCLNDFNRGVWIGKYPGSLCRNIHIVSTESPIAVNETGFIRWILSDGQGYISEAGFSELIPGERLPKIQSLSQKELTVIESTKNPVRAATILFIVATAFFAGLVVFVIVRLIKAGPVESGVLLVKETKGFNEESIVAPDGLFYDKSHTWTFMEKDGIVKVGIDDFLQHITGSVTKIKMKPQGTKVKKGEKIISLVQNGKQLDIYSPISGLITGTNNELVVNSGIINNSPYKEGWVYLIEPDNWVKEIRKYLMGNDYHAWLKTEFARLKDFIAGTVKSRELTYAQVVLQDGGEIRNNLLENFGPDVWEEFQRGFIDDSI